MMSLDGQNRQRSFLAHECKADGGPSVVVWHLKCHRGLFSVTFLQLNRDTLLTPVGKSLPRTNGHHLARELKR